MGFAEIFGGHRPDQAASISGIQSWRVERGYPEKATFQLEGRGVDQLTEDQETIKALLEELNTSYREGI